MFTEEFKKIKEEYRDVATRLKILRVELGPELERRGITEVRDEAVGIYCQMALIDACEEEPLRIREAHMNNGVVVTLENADMEYRGKMRLADIRSTDALIKYTDWFDKILRQLDNGRLRVENGAVVHVPEEETSGKSAIERIRAAVGENGIVNIDANVLGESTLVVLTDGTDFRVEEVQDSFGGMLFAGYREDSNTMRKIYSNQISSGLDDIADSVEAAIELKNKGRR